MCEEKLVLAQEELVANRNQLSAHETQIQELKTARTELEKDLGKRDEKIKQQVEALQKLQKQQVTKYAANFWDITVVPSSKPLNHRFSCGVKVTETNATGLDSVAINKESVPDTVRLQYNLLLWAGIVITLICLQHRHGEWSCSADCVFCFRNKLRSSWRRRSLNARSSKSARVLWRRTKTNCLLILKLWSRRKRRSDWSPLTTNHFYES